LVLISYSNGEIEMKRIANTLAWVLLSIGESQAYAGSGAHGGDALVCFDIPVDQAVTDKGILTEEGRKHIKSAVTNEYFQNRKAIKSNPVIQKLEKLSFEEALAGFYELFSDVPVLQKELLESRKF